MNVRERYKFVIPRNGRDAHLSTLHGCVVEVTRVDAQCAHCTVVDIAEARAWEPKPIGSELSFPLRYVGAGVVERVAA